MPAAGQGSAKGYALKPASRAPPAAQGGSGPPILAAKVPPHYTYPSHFSAPSQRPSSGTYSRAGLPPSRPAPSQRANVYVPPASLSSKVAQQQAAAQAQRQAELQHIQDLFTNHALSEHIKTSGGFPSIGTIAPYLVPGLGQLKAISHVPGLIGAGAKDLINLPSDTLKGVESFVPAAAHDLGQALNLAPSNPNDHSGSHLLGMVSSAWKQSVLGHLANNDLSGAWHAFSQHPVYGASEFTGLGGLVGRTAGAAMRSGLVGSRLAAVADTARADRALMEADGHNLLPAVQQHYSPNVLVKGGQKLMEQFPKAQQRYYALTRRGPVPLMKKSVNETVATSKAREQHSLAQTTQRLHDSMPGHKPAAGVVPYAVQATAPTHTAEAFAQGLQHIHDELKVHEPNMHGTALQMNQAHQRLIESFLGDPQFKELFHNQVVPSATAYGLHQHTLDAQLVDHGLLDASQAARREVEPFIKSGGMPGVSLVQKGDALPTPAAAEARGALQDLKAVANEAKQAPIEHKLNMAKVRLGTTREIRDARERLAQARKQEAKAQGVLTGRHGLGEPLPPHAANRMWRYQDRVTQAEQDLKAVQQHAAAARVEQRKYGLDRIAATKGNLKDAVQQYNQVHKPFANEKVAGIVREHGDGTASQVPVDEIQRYLSPVAQPADHAAAVSNTHIPPAYVNASLPADRLSTAIRSKFNLTRGGSRGKAYTGQGLEAGAYRAGYGALSHSQLGTTAKLEKAISQDTAIKHMALKDEHGQPMYFNENNWRAAADHYTAETGIPVEPVPAHPRGISEVQKAKIAEKQGHADNWTDPLEATLGPKDNLVLAPKPMLDQHLAHMEVDRKGGGYGQYINRKFRNSVLPFSPKWLTGNVVEALGRASLVGAGPRDWLLANKVIKQMRDAGRGAEADQLERMATGGLHYGMQERANREAIGIDGTQGPHPAIAAARNAPVLKQLSRGYDSVVQGIFKFNRHLESNVEKAVLGAHMKRQMQEFAGTWAKAATAQKQYIDKLAQGYADPKLAADAGRYIHQTLGQYDRFSPKMRSFTRTIAPFSPWYLNAAKFVYHTLPIKHPLTQAVLLDVARAHQQDYQNNVPHDTFRLPFGMGQVPVGDLLSAQKVGDGAYLNAGRYTPMGAFTNGPLDYGMNMVLPQGSGAIRALVGQDPFGRSLRDENGNPVTDTGDRLAQALSNLAEGFAGPLNQIHRVVAEHGSTPYNTEKFWDWNPKVKPNTQHGDPFGFARVFDPFMPTFLQPQNKKAGKGGAVSGKGFAGGGGGGAVSGKGYVAPGTNSPGYPHASTPAQKAAAIKTALVDFQALKAKGLLPAGAKTPKIVVDKTDLLQGRPYVLNKVVHLPPGFPALLSKGAAPYLNAWARASVIHELGHTAQNENVPASVDNIEGGNQAWTLHAAPQVLPHYQYAGSGNYTHITDENFQREPESWLFRGQYTPGVTAPTINLPIGRDFAPSARTMYDLGYAPSDIAAVLRKAHARK